MPIDIDRETLIHFPEARSAFPGKRVSLATLHRWRLHGSRGVKLDTVAVGHLRYTSAEAIGRFIRAQNADETPAPQFTATQRQRMANTANRALEAAGL